MSGGRRGLPAGSKLNFRRTRRARRLSSKVRPAPLSGFLPLTQLAAAAAARRHSPRQREALEEEVAILAQEAVNTNRPQEERRVSVAPSDAAASTLRAPAQDHRL